MITRDSTDLREDGREPSLDTMIQQVTQDQADEEEDRDDEDDTDNEDEQKKQEEETKTVSGEQRDANVILIG